MAPSTPRPPELGLASGTEPLRPDEDGSHLSPTPGAYEWWNFFASDPQRGLTVSAIFMPANLFDTDYRRAVHRHRRGLGPAPDPRRHGLLQLNVVSRGRKVFSSIRNPPGTTAGFDTEVAAGRIGSSHFHGGTDDEGATTYRVHLDAPTMTNLGRLRAELSFREPAGGVRVGGGGLFAGLPGGAAHHWQFPLGLPAVRGHVQVEGAGGRTILESDLAGSGYTDHFWGPSLLGDCLDSWYFGRADLGERGALIVVWLTPRDAGAAPCGRMLRLRPDAAATIAAISSLHRRRPRRGRFGFAYHRELELLSPMGRVRASFGPLIEDWPFQVAGEGRFEISLAGEPPAVATGPIEHLRQADIDDPLFALMDRSLRHLPWFGRGSEVDGSRRHRSSTSRWPPPGAVSSPQGTSTSDGRPSRSPTSMRCGSSAPLTGR